VYTYLTSFTHSLFLVSSLAGLLTARICADHFEKVYIIEPEAWVFTSEEGVQVESWKQKNKRTRVMQYYSAHGKLSNALCVDQG